FPVSTALRTYHGPAATSTTRPKASPAPASRRRGSARQASTASSAAPSRVGTRSPVSLLPAANPAMSAARRRAAPRPSAAPARKAAAAGERVEARVDELVLRLVAAHRGRQHGGHLGDEHERAHEDERPDPP